MRSFGPFKQLAVVLLLTSSFAVSQVTLSLTSSGTSGNTVVLDISLDAPSGSEPAALQWTLNYSTTDFSAISITTAGAATAASKSISCNTVPGGPICLVWGMNTNTISRGVIATVTLTVSTATSNVSSSVQLSSSVAASPAGQEIASATSGTTVPLVSGATIAVTVRTITPGPAFTVDGTTYSTPQVFNWFPGSSHTLSTAASEGGGTGIQYVWNSWNDGGAISHTIAPTSATTISATYSTQFYLTTAASPVFGGTMSPASGWYASGATVSVSATPNSGYTFSNFSGALTGAAAPQVVMMTAPQSVSANFQLSTGGTPFISGFSTTGRAIRNDIGGWVGTQFTVGPAAFNVASVGRLCLPDNSGKHTVKFTNVATGQDVPASSAVVNMAGCMADQFVYASLPGAVVLQTGASYYLVSSEESGADTWYDFGPVTTTSAASITNSIYNNGLWLSAGSADTAYGPPNFMYSLAGSDSTIIVNGVLNAASYAKGANGQGSAVAPGSLVQIYATLTGATTAIAESVPLPLSLGGVSVTFNGIPAPISAVMASNLDPLINAQVPFEVLPSGGSTTADVVVTVNGISSAAQQIPIVSAAAGIFTTAQNGQGQAMLVNLANLLIATPSDPMPRGGTALFYTTGLGELQPTVADGAAGPASPAVAIPTVFVGGITAQVLFAGQAPGYPGVNQVNIVIPVNAPTGTAVPLQIQNADGTGTTSILVTVAIQ